MQKWNGLENLESRIVMSSWDGGGDGMSFDDPMNWSDDQIPGVGETVVIDSPTANVVIDSSPDATIGDLDLRRGSLTLEGGSRLSMRAGQVGSGGSIHMEGGELDLESGASALSISGHLDWSGGEINGPGTVRINAGGSATIAGNATLDTTLVNRGDFQWTSGEFRIRDGVFQNESRATFESNQRLQSYHADSLLVNEGMLRYDGLSTSLTVVEPRVENRGTIDVEEGGLRFEYVNTARSGYSENSGQIIARAHGDVHLWGDFDHTSAVFRGDGDITFREDHVFSGPTAFHADAYVGNGTDSRWAVLDGAMAFRGGGTITFERGHLAAESSVTFDTPAMMDNGFEIIGNGDVSILRRFDFSGGSMGGEGRTIVKPGAYMTMSGNASVDRLLINRSTTVFSGGDVFVQDVFRNDPTGTFNMTEGWRLRGAGTFVNKGDLNAQGGSFHISSIEVTVENEGTIRAVSGLLRLLGGGENSGMYQAREPAALRIESNMMHTDASFSGLGQILVQSSTQTFAGRNTFTGANIVFGYAGDGNLAFSTIEGTPSMRGTSVLYLNRGTLQNDSTVVLDVRAVMDNGFTVTGAGSLFVDKDFSFHGGSMTGHGSTIFRDGRMDIADGAYLDRQLVNNTVTVLSSGRLNVSPNGEFRNNASGAFRLVTTDSIQGSSGSLVINSGQMFYDGPSSHDFQFHVPVQSGGIIRAERGVLEFHGGLTNTGTIVARPNAEIEVRSDAVHDGAHFTGSGEITFLNGTQRFRNTTLFTASEVSVEGAILQFDVGHGSNPVFRGSSMLELNSGQIKVDSRLTMAMASTMHSSFTVTGSANLFLVADMTIEGGTMSGSGQTIVDDGVLRVDGTLSLQRSILNRSRMEWTDGNISFGNGSRIRNEALFVASTNGTMSDIGDNDGFVNIGTFVYDSDASESNGPGGGEGRRRGRDSRRGNGAVISPEFNNVGTVIVQSGAISFDDVTQYDDNRLNAGTWDVRHEGDLQMPGLIDVLNANATVELRGDATFVDLESLTVNRGTLIVGQGHELRLHSLTNSGHLDLHRNAFLVLEGGSFSIQAGSLVSIDLGAEDATRNRARIDVQSGQAHLGGRLDIDLVQGYGAPGRPSFDLVEASAGRTGRFGQADLPEFNDARSFDLSYLGDGVDLRVI